MKALKRLWPFVPFALVAAGWLAYQYWLPLLIAVLDRKADLQGANAFGDSYGALNTLFAGLAFAGIIISIVLQSQELRDTREELRGQRIQLERQAFENAFFQMLRLHNEIVASLKYQARSTHHFEGKQSFQAMKQDFVGYFLRDPGLQMPVEERYTRYFLTHAHWTLGHYFRNLYQIVKYVHNSPVSNKKFYTNIIRAQLSSDELFLLFFNALSSFGREKFLPLIVEYEMLEQLPADRALIDNADAARFGRKAFGDSPEWKEYLGHG